MYCSRCSHELRPTDKFCANCATTTVNFKFDASDARSVELLDEEETRVRPDRKRYEFTESPFSGLDYISETEKYRRHKFVIGIGAALGLASVGLLLLAAGAFTPFFVQPISPNNTPSVGRVNVVTSPRPVSTLPPATPAPTPLQVAVSTPINTPVPIVPTQTVFNGSDLLEPSGSRWYRFTVGPNGGRLEGAVEADGGLRGEIECFVTNEEGAQNIGRGLSGSVWYTCGKVHMKEINTTLGSGQYCLLFRNPSPWTTRTIRGTIAIMAQ